MPCVTRRISVPGSRFQVSRRRAWSSCSPELGKHRRRIPIAYSRLNYKLLRRARMRPRVKGSFLNARCGLTDSPPCPPTTPPPPRPPRTDIPDAGAATLTSSPYVHVRIRARPDFTTIRRCSLSLCLRFFSTLTGLKLRVTSEFMHLEMCTT